jgi:hypothetical protein
MTLSMEQQLQLLKHAETGLRLESCLLCLGLRSDVVEELLKDKDLIHIWNTGRAKGAQIARRQLAEESRSGNVSAMRALKLFQTDDKAEERTYPREQLSSAERKARDAAWRKDFDARWERYRQIHEGTYHGEK